MSDTKGSNPSRNTAPHRVGVSGEAGASSSKPTQKQAPAATQYWQGVAAAGRAAKPAATPSAEATTTGRQRGVRS